jgi:hypothetical protein
LSHVIARSTQSRETGGLNDWLAGTRYALHSAKNLVTTS